jgi:hypothetical protein
MNKVGGHVQHGGGILTTAGTKPTYPGYAGNGDCKGEGQRQNFDLAGRPSAGPAKDASLATVSDTRTDNISQ